MHQAWLLGAVVCYLGAVFMLYKSLLAETAIESNGARRTPAIVLTSLGALCHALAQSSHWLPTDQAAVSLLNVMSLCALVGVVLLLLSLLTRSPLFDAGLVVLPLAVIVLGVELTVPAPANLLNASSPALAAHVFSSVMAFGLLGLAGVYAGFIAIIDHFLRHHHLNRLVRALPPLQTLEALLFRLIAIGFVLLTVSLATGLLFVDDLLAQHLAHKTILAVVAWIIFGLLLVGRRAWGWRGRMAVRLTLAGVAVLLLAYFGSKLVLEVLLGEHWAA
ncbi:phosphohydrolase [Marinihelvus fidelis]|uniref:Phosphohydrolase n=1 Tax=Marinihelvus fidelis TaxID=2613842 RepID=A0A5N0TAC8_9GAMM|nr:cytochrome c biogenesis protein CcsA [Marinihelvus fidelis]KAA9131890.1 phosphohydrolase [Marinihelvus fidelis]